LTTFTDIVYKENIDVQAMCFLPEML